MTIWVSGNLSRVRYISDTESRITVRLKNTGKQPAFMTKLDITGAKRAIVASDNYLWLAPGETRDLTADVLWREKRSRATSIQVSAWNAPVESISIAPKL